MWVTRIFFFFCNKVGKKGVKFSQDGAEKAHNITVLVDNQQTTHQQVALADTSGECAETIFIVIYSFILFIHVKKTFSHYI